MKILVENSTWNNIGDGFYQSSLYSLIKQMYPNDDVLMEEGPMNRAFRPKIARQKDNFFNLMSFQTADVHVFSGPMIPQLLNNYKQKIIDIKSRGADYMLISVSGAGVQEGFRQELGAFLKKYPPILFSSRDEETYSKFKEFVPESYNGICTAFIVNRMLPVDEFKPKTPFFISSFYSELEPIFKTNGPVILENVSLERKNTYLNLSHNISRHLNFLRPQQVMLDTHQIVRVHQDLSTHFYHIKFSHPNSFMSFNLLSYLAMYKSADFTISDRVHSCAVSLAFGKPARLFTKSPRAGIFDRLGFDYKSNGGIIKPNLDVIDVELDKLKVKIKSVL
ncbi:MAG TPA: polysaccharide pyruvyl transferase family protein [Pedobacter sp.]|uniref:polysaccharide pyruvyl transferase family protein n=1 Tax=Pedobacter sp. TaxID=1411316 RepID=UPI002C39ED1E|nr:polysaccharide pyruvyl transferase family protein [Pedobacter sp.]HMI00882.1 polysaccharide pyruvyl transferase family protein [Pedobacter sp.]